MGIHIARTQLGTDYRRIVGREFVRTDARLEPDDYGHHPYVIDLALLFVFVHYRTSAQIGSVDSFTRDPGYEFVAVPVIAMGSCVGGFIEIVSHRVYIGMHHLSNALTDKNVVA